MPDDGMFENKSEPELRVEEAHTGPIITTKCDRDGDYSEPWEPVAEMVGATDKYWHYADLFASAPETKAQRDDLLAALTGIGVLPDGYCFCPKDRDAHRPEHEHTGECQAARAAICRSQGGGDD